MHPSFSHGGNSNAQNTLNDVDFVHHSARYTSHAIKQHHLLTLQFPKSTILTIRYQTPLPSFRNGQASLFQFPGNPHFAFPRGIYTTADPVQGPIQANKQTNRHRFYGCLYMRHTHMHKFAIFPTLPSCNIACVEPIAFSCASCRGAGLKQCATRAGTGAPRKPS
jgi:hypothetical protein